MSHFLQGNSIHDAASEDTEKARGERQYCISMIKGNSSYSLSIRKQLRQISREQVKVVSSVNLMEVFE